MTGIATAVAMHDRDDGDADGDDRPTGQGDRPETGLSGPGEEDEHEHDVHGEAGDRVEPHARRGDRSIHARLLQVPHVECHAAHARGREVARERRGDLRQQRRDGAQARGHRAAHAERGADVGQRREQHDERNPAPLGGTDLAEDARQVGQLRQEEVGDRHEHRGGEDALPADPLERDVARLADFALSRDGVLQLLEEARTLLEFGSGRVAERVGLQPCERVPDRLRTECLDSTRHGTVGPDREGEGGEELRDVTVDLVVARGDLAEREAGEPRLAVAVDENVGAPQVAMSDAVLSQARRPAPTGRAGTDPRLRGRACGPGGGPRPSRRR